LWALYLHRAGILARWLGGANMGDAAIFVTVAARC